MKKCQNYEYLYISFTWLFIALSIFYLLLTEILQNSRFFETGEAVGFAAYFITLTALNLYKYILVKKEKMDREKYIIAARIIEAILLAVGMVFIGLGEFGFMFFIIMIIIASLSNGMKAGLVLFTTWSFSIFAVYIISEQPLAANIRLKDSFEKVVGNPAEILSFFAIYFLLIVLCGKIQKDSVEREEENLKLVKELEEKYDLLAIAQEEARIQYERIKDANIKLEESNSKLTSSIAEFFTLQQISQAISSIFDVRELLKYVNDIILGVMGVNYSTIALFDEKRNKLKVHTTNIRDRQELIALTDNINCSLLHNALQNAKPVLENFVDHEEYVFTRGRDINSLICVPLNTKSRRFGMVIVEQKYNNAFDDSNVRLLDIIGQQVGIAMENAELYQRMQEMATTDGLTGVYNRQYFQERLGIEFENAKNEGYHLSLAIFDIDHFKRFNDTFGHLFGDKVLKSISERVRNSLRGNDLLARFGGEEFIILFPHTTLEEAYEKVESLRRLIAETQVRDELISASVTVSFGISSFPEYASGEAELLRSADDALYRAKEDGRNCARVASKL